MTTNNSINIQGTGVVIYNGTGTFTASTLTQYNSLVGSTSNLITSVAPNATVGQPFCSNGTSSNPSYKTLIIAGGGTGSTSYTATNGIISYDGSVFINNSGTTIDSSGIYHNTNQPAFFAYLNTTLANVTGDDNKVTVPFDTAPLNVGNCFNTSTGIFTAPIAGAYIFNSSITLIGLNSSATFTQYYSIFNINGFEGFLDKNTQILPIKDGDFYCVSSSIQFQMNGGDTLKVYPNVVGHSKTVGYAGKTGSTIRCFFSGYLTS